MILVNGGSSSGKSAFAESLIVKEEKERQRIPETGGGSECLPSWYLATMIAWDEECRERIRKHRMMRAEKNFRTLECPVDIGNAKVPENSRVLLECLSNLTANEMYRDDLSCPEEGAEERIVEGIRKIQEQAGLLVIVTNDVSGDHGPYSEETERYRRLLGDINRLLAEKADEVYEVFCGIPVKRKGIRREETSHTGDNIQNMEKHTEGFTLFTGGAYQGKTKLALSEAAGKRKDHFICTADGRESPLEHAFSSEAVLNLHMYIKRMIEDAWDKNAECENAGVEELLEKKMYGFLDELLQKNPSAVITCDELGCGIVPVAKQDRLWREMTGDACQYLAERAKKVCRVTCGLAEVLKGGES